MLAKRLLVVILLIPLGAAIIVAGGLVFDLVAAAIFAVAAWEYCRLFRMGGWYPATLVVVGGVLGLVLSRAFYGFHYAGVWLSLTVLVSMSVHLFAYERGREQAATDFGITIGGILYIGWLGAYLVTLRHMPDGKWWMLTSLPAVWIADAGAFWIGSRLGRHAMAPRLSPKKTWEGYFGGVLFGTVGGAVLGGLWGLATPVLNPLRGALLGLVLAVFTPLGDLGESMIKRQAKAKDSSSLIPGHGGFLDRIDSWLWAGIISYLIIFLFW